MTELLFIFVIGSLVGGLIAYTIGYLTDSREVMLRSKMMDYEFKEKELYCNMNIEEKKKILNDLIQESFNEYIIFNSNKSKDDYMAEKDIKEMQSFICKKTIHKITPALLVNIKMVYRAETTEDLIEVIGYKSAPLIMEYSKQVNIDDQQIIV